VKLLRLKLTDTKPFRSLQPDFEYHFRTEWELEDELKESPSLAPFVCAGPNGSGKSNLLELIAAIFFQLEVLRVRPGFLPEAFYYDEETNPDGIPDGHGIPTRYAARCCSKAGGTSWRNKVLDECQNYRLDPAEMCEAEIKTAKCSPWHEANFLKVAFLEGCQQTGMFS